MGVMSAFIFAGQMVNFPVASGTSGHLLGAALAALFLGPATAILSLATVVTVQCLLFQDGGVTALGANLLNMAVAGTLVAAAVQKVLQSVAPGQVVLTAAVSAWASIMAAASLCSVELAGAGTVRFQVVAPAMLLTHGVIGVGEAVITAAVAGFVLKLRPDLAEKPFQSPAPPRSFGRALGLAGTALIGATLLLAPWASGLPDGLEFVAHRLGFADREQAVLAAPAAGYAVPGLNHEGLSTILAGLIGTAACFAIVAFLARWWRHRRKPAVLGPAAGS